MSVQQSVHFPGHLSDGTCLANWPSNLKILKTLKCNDSDLVLWTSHMCQIFWWYSIYNPAHPLSLPVPHFQCVNSFRVILMLRSCFDLKWIAGTFFHFLGPHSVHNNNVVFLGSDKKTTKTKKKSNFLIFGDCLYFLPKFPHFEKKGLVCLGIA